MAKRTLVSLVLLVPLGCGMFGENVKPETRAQVGDAVAGTGSVVTAAGTATANPLLLVIGGLLVAAGAVIRGTGTPKEENKA